MGNPRTEKYRSIVRQVIDKYARFKPSHGEIRTEAVIDIENDHYELLHVGWNGPTRVHGSVIHIDIIDDKVWVEHDGTDAEIVKELEDAGIPKEHIVLGFKSPRVRKHTGYATS
ncbi:MAG: XisI protein [Planctomycetes bacterium]|nr:XisI protein [Planctomycetota bacterium]